MRFAFEKHLRMTTRFPSQFSPERVAGFDVPAFELSETWWFPWCVS